MNIYYTIIMLRFRYGLPEDEIARILSGEIRRSGENTIIRRGQKVLLTPLTFVMQVIETEQIEINKQKLHESIKNAAA